jgi:hypothetical protein
MGDWFEEGGTGAPLDVIALLDSQAGASVLELVALGALVSMGLTSDGGALGITVTVDGRWRREYFRDPEALTDWVDGAAAAVAAAVEEARGRRSSSAPRRRSRGL